MIAGCVTALCLLNYKLFLFVSVVSPLAIFILLYFRPRIKKILENIRRMDADIISFFIERFNNIKLIQSYNTYEYEKARLDSELNMRFDLGMKRIKLMALNFSLMGVVMSFTIVILFSYGGYLIVQEVLTIGSLMAFVNYLVFLMNPLKDMQSLYMEYIRTNVSMERVNEILEQETIIEENKNRGARFIFSDKININSLSFDYGGKKVLKDLNIEFRKGRTYAIVGSSGSGKSTLMNLIMQFSNFEKGEILIDGVPIKSMDIFDLRDNISYVSQDSYLFNDSIAENIKRGKFNATDSDIVETCKHVGIYDYVQTLDMKFESRLGERGVKISGGEKQRIAIARAFLKENEIIILDEAFASLDSDSEKNILSLLKETYKESLILMISHRLSTIKNVDEVILIKDGRVVEQGTHDDLIGNKSAYFDLFCEQLI